MKQYCRIAGIDGAKAHFHVLEQSCVEHVRKRLGDTAMVRDWLGYEDTLSPMGYQFCPKNRREPTAERLKDFGALARRER